MLEERGIHQIQLFILIFVVCAHDIALSLIGVPTSTFRAHGTAPFPLEVFAREQAISNVENHNEDSTYQVLSSNLERMQRLQNLNSVPGNDMDRESFRNFVTRCSKYVEVAPSPIAGKGLFAKRSIPKNTIVSFYPVHVLGVEYDDDDSRSQFVSLTEEFVPDKESSYRLYLLGQRPLLSKNGIQFTTEDGSRIYVDVEKNSQPDIPGWLSHYSNDGAIVHGLSETDMLEYYQKTKECRNCVLIPFGPAPMMATMTTQKVAKGQELLTSYGVSYWLETIIEAQRVSLSREEENDLVIPDSVQSAAKEFTRELVNAVQTSQVRYKNEQAGLNNLFRAL